MYIKYNRDVMLRTSSAEFRLPSRLSVPHFTKYLLSYIGSHGYILYRHVPKLWDYVWNRSYSSTTKFGNLNLTARYFLNTPKIAENRKISNLKDTHYLKFSAPS